MQDYQNTNPGNDTTNAGYDDCDNGTESRLIDPQRRAFSRLGLAGPVILSLASRPVLAGNCLSNMLSGNLSSPERGLCSLGYDPLYWASLGVLGNLDFSTATINDIGEYVTIYGIAEPNNTLADILSGQGGTASQTIWITAYLNSIDPSNTYILTLDQLIALSNGTSPIPGNISLEAFLTSTWTA